MDLNSKTCVPCRGGVDPLTLSEATAMMEHVPGWELTHDGHRLERTFRFANFREANAFANRVGELAEAEDHHPEITFGWGYARVAIWTHKINGLHENDFILAAKANAL